MVSSRPSKRAFQKCQNPKMLEPIKCNENCIQATSNSRFYRQFLRSTNAFLYKCISVQTLLIFDASYIRHFCRLYQIVGASPFSSGTIRLLRHRSAPLFIIQKLHCITSLSKSSLQKLFRHSPNLCKHLCSLLSFSKIF